MVEARYQVRSVKVIKLNNVATFEAQVAVSLRELYMADENSPFFSLFDRVP